MPVEMRQCNICGHITERNNFLDHIVEAHGVKTIELISSLVDKNINVDEEDDYPCTDCSECLTDGDRCVNEDTCEKWKIYTE